MAIPLIDVKAQYEPLLPELKERISAVLEDGRFILGPNVQAFEQEAADYLGVEHGVGVANGTDALLLVLEAMGIGPGDEVICPAFTFYATAESIARRGATPVFADIDPETLNLDPEDVAARVTKQTRAIMPVHLFGRPAPIAELAEIGPPLIEDAAQAFGSPGIATSAASTFSFYPTKNLFGLGDGGLVATPDGEIAERVRMLRFHGSKDKADFYFVGCNSRLDEIQATALRLFLGQLDGWTSGRREAAERYRELGVGEYIDTPADEPGHVYHLFVSRSPERDAIIDALKEQDIAARRTTARRSTSSPRCASSATARDRCPRPSARGRELRRPALAGDTRRRPGARGRGSKGGRERENHLVIPSRHRVWQLFADAALVAAAWYLAFQLRFDRGVPVFYETLFERTILIVLGIKLVVFLLFGFYNHWWRYVSTRDMWRIVRGVTVACLVADLTVYLINPVEHVRLPRGIAATDWLLTLILVAGARLLVRSITERPSPRGIVARGKEVLVVGAGDAAQLIVREMLKSPALGYTPIGLVDDDPRKKNLRLHGVRVLGTTDDLSRLLRESKPDEVLIAIPSAAGDVRQQIVNVASDAGVPVKTLPGHLRAHLGRPRPRRADPSRPGGGRARPRAGRGRPRGRLDVRRGRNRARHRRRRVDRLRALPPDRAPRRRAPRPRSTTPSRRCSRSSASSSDERGFPRCRSRSSATSRTRRRCARSSSATGPKIVFHAAAYKHVRYDGGEPDRGGAQQRPRDARRSRRSRSHSARSVSSSSRRTRRLNPTGRDGASRKTLCEWIVEAYGHRADVRHAVRRRPVRQRPRLRRAA